MERIRIMIIGGTSIYLGELMKALEQVHGSDHLSFFVSKPADLALRLAPAYRPDAIIIAARQSTPSPRMIASILGVEDRLRETIFVGTYDNRVPEDHIDRWGEDPTIRLLPVEQESHYYALAQAIPMPRYAG